MSDDKMPLTADEAISLLSDGDDLHTFMSGGFALIGCDTSRADAIEAIKAAAMLEIGGPACKALDHALVVHTQRGHVFYKTDPARVEAMETTKAAAEGQANG